MQKLLNAKNILNKGYKQDESIKRVQERKNEC